MKQLFLPFITLIVCLLLTGCGQPRNKNMARGLTPTQQAFTSCHTIFEEYSEILVIMENSLKTEPERINALHQYILLKNDALQQAKQTPLFYNAKYIDLPYLQFKSGLDRALRQLRHYQARMHQRPKGLCNIPHLITRLDNLNSIMVVLPQYHKEKVKAADPHNTFPFNILKTGVLGLIGKIITI